MDKHDYLRSKIKSQLERIREKNPRLSERYFATVLGIAPSTFSEFMSGKRAMSKEMVDRVFSKLDVSQDEFQEFQSLEHKKERNLARFESMDLFLRHTKTRPLGTATFRYVGEIDERRVGDEAKLVALLNTKTMNIVKDRIAKFEAQIVRLVEEQDESSEKMIYSVCINLKSLLPG